MSMYMGFHYTEPKRGDGYSLKAGNLYFPFITKASANEIKRELLNRGFGKEEIEIEKN